MIDSVIEMLLFVSQRTEMAGGAMHRITEPDSEELVALRGVARYAVRGARHEPWAQIFRRSLDD